MTAPADIDIRKELEALRIEVNRRIDRFTASLDATVAGHTQRLDDHDLRIAGLENGVRDVRTIVHTMQGDLYRATDALTGQGLVLERLDRNTNRVLELLQPEVAL